jgi:hypothetical protein
LIADVGRVEVAHEAILRQWPALATWIGEERDALSSLEAVRAAAREWQARKTRRGKASGSWLTHRGNRLREAEKVASRVGFATVADPVMREYLAACRRARMQRRSLQILGILFIVLVVAAAAILNWDFIRRGVASLPIAT